jgi:uncharacterized membrane protein
VKDFRHVGDSIAQSRRIRQAGVDLQQRLRDTRPRLMRFALTFLMLCSTTASARAALIVCNKTERPTKIALGRFEGHDWLSQGWWAIAAHACATLLPGPLDARYYYLYASDSALGGWDGGWGFCTAPADSFRIVGRANCSARGFERKGFFQVDTGQARDFTQSLSE